MKKRDHRAPEPWKVRWCGPCRQYEYDTGSPRGWVMLMGDPPEGSVAAAVDELRDKLGR